MTSKIATKVATGIAGKKAKQFEPQDPLYENYTNEQGKTKRRKRAVPEGLTAEEQRILIKVRKRAHYLDKGINICGFRFGYSFLLGLIPLLGDIIDALLAYNLVIKPAKKCDLPAMLVSKMQGNTLLAALVGTIPIVGDIIMAAFKPNTRNALMFEEFLIERARTNAVGGYGTVAPGNEDAQAQTVLNRANQGNWSSRTGQHDTLHASNGAPVVPPRMAGTAGRADAPAIPPRM